MASLEEQVAVLVPHMPPESVIEAFRLGASIRNIVTVAGLSGPAVARAKLRLGSLRQEAVSQISYPDGDALQEALQEIAWIRSSDVMRQAIAEQFRFGEMIVESSKNLVDLCDKQREEAGRLEAINARIAKARSSSLIGARSSAALLADHQRSVAALRTNFLAMRQIAYYKSHLIDKGTRYHERLLFLAGCSVREIVEAGGTTRTSRTTRNRIQRLIPLFRGHISVETVASFKSALRGIAITERNVANLERTIRRDLAVLEREPGSTSLVESFREDRLTPGAWSNTFWNYSLNEVRRAQEQLGPPPAWLQAAGLGQKIDVRNLSGHSPSFKQSVGPLA